MRDLLPRILAGISLLLVACPPPPGEPAPGEIRKVALPPAVVRADDPALVQYTLRFAQRHSHHVDVEALFPAGQDTLELAMAVWTPGSYLVREYSRHVESITAATVAGAPLAITKTAKNRWRVDAEGADRVAVRYRLYARELSVRTNYVNQDIAILNGAPTFLIAAGNHAGPFDLAIELPEGWEHSVTALEPHPGGAPHRYVAPDYDTLVDAPIVAGNAELHDMEIEGVLHRLASFGGAGIWDNARAARDVEAITRAQLRFWGTIPYRHYVILNVLIGGRGGLEHRDSTLLLASRWAMRKREDYRRWLSLYSHELFHTWNIKRLRPEALGPFDYESENYTRSLWVAEGLTSYYADLLVRRAGLITDEEYLDMLSGRIETVQTTPGRAVQSLSDSSFDTWIKFYRPDENTRNTQVSYYTKGAVVGFLLDAEIRRLTQSRRSLDDVMRLAYERFSGERGFSPEDFQAVIAEVAGQPLSDLLARAVDGTDELDYTPALSLYGLRFATPKGDKAEDDDEQPGYLGLEVKADGTITAVPRDTPAFAAGLNVGDEILAIDDFRIERGGLDQRLERYRPGDRVVVLVSRHGVLRRVDVTLGDRPQASWKLELDPRASLASRQRRDRWLASPP